jgi:fucose permease
MYRYTARERPIAGRRGSAGAYRRDRTTWAAFAALFAFGFLNAVLGPALPYIRAAEGISYLLGSLHQVAFALGGGLAGMLAARARRPTSRATLVAAGLTGAAIAGLALGYGATPAITTVSAMLMSLLATSALIRLWAVLADVHGAHRAVAMTEGEVSVSLAGIATPLLIGALAATALSWRFAFVCGAVIAGLAALWVRKAPMPPSADSHSRCADSPSTSTHRRLQPTLIVVFAIVALEFTLSFWLASYLNDDIGLARGTAVAAVSGLYASNLAGRLLASRLARRTSVEALLAGALATALFGLPFLLGATDAPVAATGIVIAGIGIGATFPLISALHIKISPRDADGALGEVLAVASIGQVAGPLAAGTIAQASGLRTGLLVLPALVVIAAAGFERVRTGVG